MAMRKTEIQMTLSAGDATRQDVIIKMRPQSSEMVDNEGDESYRECGIELKMKMKNKY